MGRSARTIVAGLLLCILAVGASPVHARRGAMSSHAELDIAAYQAGKNWYSDGRINQCPDGQLVRGFRMNIRDDPERLYAGGIRSMGGSCNVWTPLGWRYPTDGSTGEYWSEFGSAAQSWPSNEASCPGNQVITGFKVTGRNSDYYISTLTAHCAEVKLEGSRIVMTDVADGTTGGSLSSYSSVAETKCGPGRAVIGFAARGGSYYSQLSLVCAPIRPAPFTLTVTSDVPLADYRQFGIDVRDRPAPESAADRVDTVALRANPATHQDATALLPGSYVSDPVMPGSHYAAFHSCGQFAMSGFIPYSCELKVGERIPPPTVQMGFGRPFVDVNEQETLTITIRNPNSKPILDLSLSHTLLRALVPDNNGYDETSCLSANGINPAALNVDPGTRRISLTGAHIPANGSCDIRIRLKPSIAGRHVDRLEAGAVTALNTLAYQGSPSATLNVQAMGTFAVQMYTTPNSRDYTGIGLDITGAAGTFSLRGDAYSNRPQVRLPAGAYTAVAVARPGLQANIDCAAATVAQNREFLCTMTLSRIAGLEPTLAFDPSPTTTGADSTLNLTLTHPGGAPILDGAVTLDLPPGLLHGATPGITGTCGSAVVARVDRQRLTLTGIAMGSGGCSLGIRVTTTDPGRFTVLLPAAAVTGGGWYSTTTASAILEVKAMPVLRLQAVSTGGAGTVFRFASPDLAAAPADITTAAVGLPNPAKPPPIAVKAAGAPVRITLSLPPGATLARAECTDANGPDTGNAGALGSLGISTLTLTIPAAQVRPGADITCVFTASANTVPVIPLVAGRVFTDNGLGDGRPNDGILNGGEAGMAGVTLGLNDCNGRAVARATTDATGWYQMPLPASAPDGLCLDLPSSPERLPTGASAAGVALASGMPTTVAGATYIYTRGSAVDRIAFTKSATVAGLDFGSVRQSSWLTDRRQTARAGEIALYPHTFIASTAGTVSFSVPPDPAYPSTTGWIEQIVADPDCTGRARADAEQLHPSGRAVTVTAGQPYCVVLRQSVPIAARPGDAYRATVESSLTLAGTSPALVVRYRLYDVTAVGTAPLKLLVEVRNLSQQATTFDVVNQARSGDLLEYRITYTNTHGAAGAEAQPISNLGIQINTARFTSFVATRVDSLPHGVTRCRKTTPADPGHAVDCAVAQKQGGQGAIGWDLDGILRPGDSGEVFFTVAVD